MAIIKVASDCSILTTQKHALCDIKIFYVDVLTRNFAYIQLRGNERKASIFKVSVSLLTNMQDVVKAIIMILNR